MADNGGLIAFVGTWNSSTFYRRGECVLRAGVLYQARTNRGDGDAKDPTNGAAYWEDLTSVVCTLTGSIDPTTASGIPAAIGSTYQRSGTGLYFKSGTGATAWTAAGGGGGSISATDGTVTVNPATSLSFPAGGLTDLGAGVAGVNQLLLVDAGSGEFDIGVGMDEHAYTLAKFTDDEAAIQLSPWYFASFAVRVLDGSTYTFRVGWDGESVEIAPSTGKVGFYGAPAVTRPEVPATPTAQDLVDALVALGLVSQAS